MSHARRSKSHPRALLLPLTAGTLAFVGLCFVAYGLFSDDPSGSSESSGSRTHGSVPVTSAPSVERHAIPVPKQANPCATENTLAEAEVSAARIAAGHWHEHVEARDALLAGRIDQTTTKAIWKRTRLAGPADIQRLDTATAAHRLARGACRALAGANGKACRVRLAVLAAAATAGHAVARDWQAHLAMMAAHKVGDMDDKHAQAMWVAAWRAAPTNLKAFTRADTRLKQAAACHAG